MRASASRSVSRSNRPADGDVLRALFGVSRRDFIRSSGEGYRLRHGSVQRFAPLLGGGHIPDMRALGKLALVYGRDLGRVIYDGRGVLGLRGLTARERRHMSQPNGIHFFNNYDAHFGDVRVLRRSLSAAFGASTRSANCAGTLQTRGASLPRHCDRTDVIVLQLFGTRLWRLERNDDPPDGLYALVRTPARRRGGWSAAFSHDSPIVELRPGSALYVPRGWWHETQSDGSSFALVITLPALSRHHGLKA